MRHSAALIVLCLSMLLAACGWHLRAPITYNNLSTLAISGGSSALLYPLRRSLTHSGVVITSTAPVKLHIISEQWSDRTVAVDSSGRQAAIELTYVLRWQLIKNDTPVSEIRTIHLASNVNQNPINATAASDELDFNKKVMRRDAIQQLERQLLNISKNIDLSKQQSELDPEPQSGSQSQSQSQPESQPESQPKAGQHAAHD